MSGDENMLLSVNEAEISEYKGDVATQQGTKMKRFLLFCNLRI